MATQESSDLLTIPCITRTKQQLLVETLDPKEVQKFFNNLPAPIDFEWEEEYQIALRAIGAVYRAKLAAESKVRTRGWLW